MNRLISKSAWVFLGAAVLVVPSWPLGAQPFAPLDVGTAVNGFQDDFNGAALNVSWKVRGQNVYSLNNGLLHIGAATGDPNHLLCETTGASNTVQEVLARMRVTSFGSGSLYTRGGVGVGVDPATSQGIDSVFRDVSAEGFSGPHMAFLDDFRAWGPGQGFVWQPNVWYWLRLRQEPNAASQGGVFDVFGKIWLADGTVAEPANWQLKWDYANAVLSATLDASQTNVLLNVSPLTENASYTLTVHGLNDQSLAANVVTNASATFVAIQPAVFITEFLADNVTGRTDSDGVHSDWIELQNQSAFTVDLAGWRLTDKPADLALWVFPSVALEPGQFLIVFASGNDRRVPGVELHTNFRLDAGGEYLALVRPDGSMAHGFAFGHQHQDVSLGLTRSTGGLVMTNLFMPAPTPGASNSAGVLGFVSDTKVNPGRGFFTTNFSLSITSASTSAEIWFTTDGGVPAPGAPGSTRYTDPILISNTTTLRAAAFLSGYAPTDVDTHTFISIASAARQPVISAGFPANWAGASADYEMDPQVITNAQSGYDITNALLSLPAVSLVAPRDDLFGAASGIYYNSSQQGDAWEREGSVELIYPDGTTGFQSEAGLRIHGYTSRDHSFTRKHSLRVSFRKRFGPARLHFPLLPDAGVNDFDQLVLRACSTDSYCAAEFGGRWEVRRATYMRDQWVRDALRDLGEPTAHGRYVHLWLNGLYWGLYNVTEALGNGFAAEHFGGGKEEYDVIKDYLLVDHGDQRAWDEAINLATAGFATEEAYQLIQGNNPNGSRNTNYPVYLNITNLVDYMIVHITAGAEDWDFNNWWTCRRRGPESAGFHFCAWDQEISNDSLTRDLTSENGAEGDPDHDDFSNWQEFIAGTNPQSAQSRLRIQNISFAPEVALAVEAVSNKTYTVLHQAGLEDNRWQKLIDIASRPTNRMEVIVDFPGGSNRFYRLVTPQQP